MHELQEARERQRKRHAHTAAVLEAMAELRQVAYEAKWRNGTAYYEHQVWA